MKFVIGMKYGNFAHTHPRTAFSMYCRPSMKVKVVKRKVEPSSKCKVVKRHHYGRLIRTLNGVY